MQKLNHPSCLCVLPVQTRYTNGSSSACIDRMPTLQRWESWEATCSSEKTLLSPILHSTHLSNFRKPSWFMIGCTAQYVWDCRRPLWEYYGNHIQQTLCCEIPLLAFQDVSILASLAVIPGPHWCFLHQKSVQPRREPTLRISLELNCSNSRSVMICKQQLIQCPNHHIPMYSATYPHLFIQKRAWNQ